MKTFERLFKEGKFFEAHEYLEAVWLGASSGEKSFYQGLIQVAVAMHHDQNKNSVGAQTCCQRAQKKLVGVRRRKIPDYIVEAMGYLKSREGKIVS